MRIEDEAGAADARLELIQQAMERYQAESREPEQNDELAGVAPEKQAQIVSEASADLDTRAAEEQAEHGVSAADKRVDSAADAQAAKDAVSSIENSPALQQDRGENWQAFSQNADTALPDAVTGVDSTPSQSAEQLNVGDLMKQMQIDSGKINV